MSMVHEMLHNLKEEKNLKINFFLIFICVFTAFHKILFSIERRSSILDKGYDSSFDQTWILFNLVLLVYLRQNILIYNLSNFYLSSAFLRKI